MANVSSVTLGTFCMSKMSAMRRSCCSLSRLALRKMSPRGGACVSSCGMAVLLADGLQPSTTPGCGTRDSGVWSLCLRYQQSRGLDSVSDRNVLYNDEAGTPDNTWRSLEESKRLRQSR